MSKFVIHRKVFFYTEEAFEPAEETHGGIVAVCNTPEQAAAARDEADLAALQSFEGRMNVVDFFFYNKEYNNIFQQLVDFYKNEYGQTLNDRDYFTFPKISSRDQALRFLQILGISFHDVVVYTTDEALSPKYSTHTAA